jgi:hypothetical protein
LGTLPSMDRLPPPLAFLFLLFSGWIDRRQQDAMDYLLEKNRILRAALQIPLKPFVSDEDD